MEDDMEFGPDMTMVIRTDGTMRRVQPALGQWFMLEELQSFVGGLIQLIELSSTRDMYLNEDGDPGGLNLPLNRWASRVTGQQIYGDVVVGPKSILDGPPEDAEGPAPAINSFGTMQYAGLPDEFGAGYAGYDADEGPAADDPVWAQALPAPPMLDVRGHEPNEDERRADLLADAARKPVRHLMQFDVFQSNFDDIVRPDEDGDCLFWSHTYELRRSSYVSSSLSAMTVIMPFGPCGKSRTSLRRALT
jgi:hypothetical protein